jgi:uncharacterized protein YydD (DUF2326 family)
MTLIKKLFFEPSSYKNTELQTITLESGLNFIVGEKSTKLHNEKENQKMNSVGKSLCIEAINFCLLKTAHESRIMKIPDIDLDSKIYFCLELEIEKDNQITTIIIKRNRTEKDPILFFVDGIEKTFDKIDDARGYLGHYILDEKVPECPSLRSMLSILIREEASLYDNILRPYHRSSLSSFEDLLKPHFYLFQIDLSLINIIKHTSKELGILKKTIASLRSDFKKIGVNPTEVGSHINDLKDSVEKLNLAIEELHPSEGLSQIKNSISDLNLKLDRLVTEKTGKQFLIKKIKSLPHLEKIDTKQVQIVYNHFKSGLGDMVEKSFQQVMVFKKQIDDFQNVLMNEKLGKLNEDIFKLDEEISQVDNEISEIYKKYEIKGRVDGLRESINLEREKKLKLEMLSGAYELLQIKLGKQKTFKNTRKEAIEKLDAVLFETAQTIADFQEDLKTMHEYIAGNMRCQFEINVSDSDKEFIDFNYRIKLDGGSGTNRIRTFIYDVLLMVNKTTSKRHPGFLIHDNIFASTGKDDMVKSLKYLYSLSKKHDFQYILTINKDELDPQLESADFDYKTVKRAEFTRQKPFLTFEYSELD